jgi:hypothetical protein
LLLQGNIILRTSQKTEEFIATAVGTSKTSTNVIKGTLKYTSAVASVSFLFFFFCLKNYPCNRLQRPIEE